MVNDESANFSWKIIFPRCIYIVNKKIMFHIFSSPRAASCSAATIRAVASAIPAYRVKVASCSCRDRGDRDGVVHVGDEEAWVSRTPPVARSISRGGRTVTPVGVSPPLPMALCHHDGDVVRARTAAANHCDSKFINLRLQVLRGRDPSNFGITGCACIRN